MVRTLGGPRTVLIAVLAVLACAPAAQAATFTVDNDNDSGPKSLRDAITKANGNGNPGTIDRIVLDGPVAGSTVTIPAESPALPPITEPVSIAMCANPAGQPCLGLRRESRGLTGLDVRADDVTIQGIAFSNWDFGVVSGAFGPARRTKLKGNWFGSQVDTESEANVVGALISGNDARIGGRTPAARNNFANNALIGLRIDGATDTRVKGNFFGVHPTAPSTEQHNGANIEVTGSALTGISERTRIGGPLTDAELASPACDGRCNLIVNASGSGSETGHGIDLNGESDTSELPSGSATISGNHIGVANDGESDAGNAGSGIFVGEADGVVVGGSEPGNRNVIGGNAVGGITATVGSPDLRIERNYIGVQVDGMGAVPDDSHGALMFGGRLKKNRFGGSFGVSSFKPASGGAVLGPGGGTHRATGNVFGVGINGEYLGLGRAAIQIEGDGNTIGGDTPGEANIIGFTNGNGIRVTANDNVITGNFIGTSPQFADIGNTDAGIYIEGNDNRIGGTSSTEQNVISNNGVVGFSAAGIQVQDAGSLRNQVLRNRGTNNWLFVDLVPPIGFGNNTSDNTIFGSNTGIQHPTFSAGSPTGSSGIARAGATVRVYLSDSSWHPGKFLGQAVANDEGNWSLTYSQPIGENDIVSANQTDLGGNSSEFSGYPM